MGIIIRVLDLQLPANYAAQCVSVCSICVMEQKELQVFSFDIWWKNKTKYEMCH